MKRNIAAMLMAASLVAVAGCAKKEKPEDLPPPPMGAEGNTGANTTPAGPTPGSQADFVASVMADRIYFDTDKSDVDAEDQATLASQAEWLKRYPATRATIEGHADERGTGEYNLALGNKRARAVKEVLISLGIPARKIDTISYGEEVPLDSGHDEIAWAKNRRVHFSPVRDTTSGR